MLIGSPKLSQVGWQRSCHTASMSRPRTGCCGTQLISAGCPASFRTIAWGMSGTYVRDNLLAKDEPTMNRVADVAAQVLDELQDYVEEASHVPWPGARTPPRPFAEVRGQVLHLWYGGPDAISPVVLACEPIPLAQIQRAP
jgi:hypothetical protein